MMLLLLSISVHGFSAQKSCENVVPGLDRMAQGVDVTRLDLFHDYSAEPSDGFVGRVFLFHCDEGKTWKSPFDNQTYQVPDEVENVVAMSTGVVISDSLLVHTTHELKESMSMEVGLDLTFDSGAFSASTTYKSNKYRLEEKENLVATNKAFVSIAVITMESSRFMKNTSLTPHLLQDLQSLAPEFKVETASQYFDFYDAYGTHFFGKANFGGSLSTWFEVNKDLTKVMDNQTISVQVKASFLSFLKAHGAYSGEVAARDEGFEKQSSHTEKYFGGQANLFDSDGYKAWWTTIAHNPWLHSGELSPIYDIIGEDVPAKNGLVQAYTPYLEYVALTEVGHRVDQYLENAMFSDSNLFKSIKQQLTDILSFKSLAPQGLALKLDKQINDDFMIPDWIRTSQVCFRYKNWNEICNVVGVVPGYFHTRASDPCHHDEPTCYNGQIFIKASSTEGQALLTKYGASFEMFLTQSAGKNFYAGIFHVGSPDAPGWLRRMRLSIRWDCMVGETTQIRSTTFMSKPINQLVSSQELGLWTARNIEPLKITWFLLLQ